MRRYKPSYFLSQAFKGLWRNGMMTLASVTVLLSCLIVMGCFTMLVLNIDHNLSSLGDLNEIVAFVDSDLPYEPDAGVSLADRLESDGNSFLGWSVKSDAEQPDYAPGSEYKVNPEDAVCGVVTMYAVWGSKVQPTDFTVTYNTSGMNIYGDLPEKAVAKDGENIILPGALSAKYNSTVEFLGWTLDVGSQDGTLDPDSAYSVSAGDAKGGNITFYAVWSEMPKFATYKIVYDANGAAVAELPTDSGIRLERIRKQLENLNNIADDGIEFISKADTLESEKEKLKDYPSLLSALDSGDNPYPDTFVITYRNNSDVATLQMNLEHIDGIYKTKCRSDLAENIESLKNGIILVFTWFMVILFVVSIFVIINTVKLAVVYRSKEITVMRYVGATKWFVALPFELEGAIIGIVSGLIAFFIQWYAYGYVQKMIMNDIQMITVMPFADIRGIMLIGCLSIGVLTGLIGSMISIRKYLKA